MKNGTILMDIESAKKILEIYSSNEIGVVSDPAFLNRDSVSSYCCRFTLHYFVRYTYILIYLLAITSIYDNSFGCSSIRRVP